MSTLTQLRYNVSKELGLDETASGVEETLVDRRLNQGVREVLKKTHLYVITGSITLTANDDEYELRTALSQDPIALQNILDSDENPLDRVSVEEIHELRRGSPSTGSTLFKYALNGANLLMLYPAPDASGTLTVYYVPLPTEMSTGTHDPSDATYGNIPVEYHDLIEFWALFRLALYDDVATAKNWQTYKTLFDQGIAQARADIRRLGGRKLGPARLARRVYVDRDPART